MTYKSIHQKLVDPWLRKWANKDANYSFTEKSKDRWILPRWQHHFLVKAGLQGIWAAIAIVIFPKWFYIPALLLSLGIMLSFKSWKPPINIVDWCCDSSLQIMLPVLLLNLWWFAFLVLIYLVTKPYASP